MVDYQAGTYSISSYRALEISSLFCRLICVDIASSSVHGIGKRGGVQELSQLNLGLRLGVETWD